MPEDAGIELRDALTTRRSSWFRLYCRLCLKTPICILVRSRVSPSPGLACPSPSRKEVNNNKALNLNKCQFQRCDYFSFWGYVYCPPPPPPPPSWICHIYTHLQTGMKRKAVKIFCCYTYFSGNAINQFITLCLSSNLYSCLIHASNSPS